ncbi:nitronate monooxygenase family protein [Mycobacterium sp. shizuoka-1]|uniref:NAD(P)H-dependent flavin oxidoreductase n=1 Tax=Mycobacterium sp. shizuoka-1 TaxID=2039281 RepID=UPI000C063917|nr:nitronate monooxygenase [Mycobacterium sp. shizuoka-1]GAY15558.1 2-nitropropane dioxygenase [Mycobacterium sp. shizuoka-1]
MPIPPPWRDRLALPAIAAPMTAVSGPELVIAACSAGVIGAFPTHNAHSPGELDDWLTEIAGQLTPASAPIAANLVVHRSNRRLATDLGCLQRHGVELVITSVGSPEAVVAPLHEAGAQVYADVATLEHAHRSLSAGVDGLVLLTAGAGGQTGWTNPLAFVRAVRAFYSGPVVLAGGITDGRSILAAEVLGADLAYLGTRFIATHESRAEPGYRQALVTSTLDDVRLSARVGGIPASLLTCWLDAAEQSTEQSGGFDQDRLLSNRTAWSAGHSVSGVSAVTSTAALIATLVDQYGAARRDLMQLVMDR